MVAVVGDFISVGRQSHQGETAGVRGHRLSESEGTKGLSVNQ